MSTKTETKQKEEPQGGAASYIPSDRVRKIVQDVYDAIDVMTKARNQTYREFNNRALVTFVDDGDKRLNTYVIDKESYDPPKEDWQANLALPTTRDKQKRILASFSLQVPRMEVKAYGENASINVDRAETAKWLVKGSYEQEQNIVVQNFWEAWECSTRGTVVVYEGYLKTRYKQKFIKSFYIVTGTVEFDEKEVDVDDKCITFLMPLTEFYIRDFYIRELQDQPDVAWIRYYDKDIFDYEFGKYPNAKYVHSKGWFLNAETDSFFYQNKWKDRIAKDNQIEVARYYNRLTDRYIILANGVLLLEAPLLWRVNGMKVYPFAKTIWEPFANSQFFYGNSFPNSIMGQTDTYDTLINTMLDKQFRSMEPGMLIGKINQDAFELEDLIITGTTKIYVDDVTQVKPVPVEGITNGDVQMLKIVAASIEESAPSLPSMMAGKEATAREVVIADEKIKELKNVHYEMMTDLWRQKFALRLANIQLNYPQPRTIYENGETKKVWRTFVVENVVLDTVTGETGVLALQFRNLDDKEKKKVEMEISVEEKQMKLEGINYKKQILPTDYLDNYRINIEVIPESIYKESQGRQQATVLEKLDTIGKYFPQIFVLNQKEYFKQLSRAYGDSPEKYLSELEKFEQAKKALEEQQAAEAAAAQSGATGTMPVAEMPAPMAEAKPVLHAS